MYVYVYIYIYIYTHTHTHTHTKNLSTNDILGKVQYLRDLICIMDFLTAYVCRRLFESTEIAGNKTFTYNFQINFSWLLGKKM